MRKQVEFSVSRGEVVDIDVAMVPRMAGIQVQAADERGNDLRAEVQVDDVFW